MQLEKWVSFSVLMLIILVAALSLTGALAMTAIDKQRELFYLRCLGMEKPQFMAIFIIQGGMTGITGTAAGTIISMERLQASGTLRYRTASLKKRLYYTILSGQHAGR